MSRIPLDLAKVGNSNGSRSWALSDHDHSPPNQHSGVFGSEQEHGSGEQKQQRRMDIDRDEAEAGSILISLASYSPHCRSQEARRPSLDESRRPMSIQSLLDTKSDQRNISSTSSHQEAISYDPMMSISEYRRDEMHTRASERYGPKINSVTSKQKTLFPPFNSLERTTYSQATENLAKQHHLIMRSYQSQPMTDLENYDDPKQHPKIKRNALHAYISYMIYTDLSNHQPFNGKLATPKDTPTGFAVVLNNNNNSNHSSDRSAYPFPSRTFQKMSNILSNDAQRTETTSVSSHRPLPTSTGSMPLLFNQGGNRNNTTADASHHHQVPQTSNSILHRPLTAYLRTATSQQHTERHQQREAPPVPSPEDFRPRPYASMPLLPGMPPNHGRKF